MKHMHYFRRKFVEMNYSSFAITARVTPTLRPFVLLFFLSFSFLHSDAGHAQLATYTLKCGTPITIDFGQVLIGDSVEYPITFTNKLSNNVTSWSITGGSPYFSFLDTAGNAQSDSSWSTSIIVKADTSGAFSAQYKLDAKSDTCSLVITLRATGIGPTKDSSTFTLQDTSKDVIAFQTNNNSDSGTFYFKNNSDTAIEIDSIYVTQSNAFSITSHPLFHYSLPGRDSFPLGIAYQRSSQGYDNGQLQFAIGMPDEPILPIALQGVRTGNDAVQTQPIGTIYFLIYPNPSYGSVTIHTENIASAHVTITDVLGREVQKADFTGDWVWNGSNNESGTYFVSITATTADGIPVCEERRVVVMK
jgi:hypothetical protein